LAGELAADGRRALVIDDRSLDCEVTYWDAQSARSWRAPPVPSDETYTPGEPALASATAAWACTARNLSIHGIDLYRWKPGERIRVMAGTLNTPMNPHGDGSLLVHNTPARLWRVVGSKRKLLLEGPGAAPVVDVDRGRIVLRSTNAVDIRTAKARLTTRIRIGRGHAAIELSGNTLVVMRERTLRIYDITTGRRTRSWALETGGDAKPQLLDAEGNFAVYLAGIAIHLVRLTDGRDLALAIENQADGGGADLEPEGLFYAYNESSTKKPGRVAFIAAEDLRQGFNAQVGRSR
jgi:hypothetical protein